MFEQTADLCGNPKKTANWLMGEGLPLLKEKGMEAEDMDFTPKHLADLSSDRTSAPETEQKVKNVSVP